MDTKKDNNKKKPKTDSVKTSIKTLKNENVELSIKNLENCKVEITVFPSSKLLDEAKNIAIKEVNKESELPGFRKGKIPKDILKARFSKKIEEKAQKEIANISFKEALNLSKLTLANPNSTITYNVKNIEEKPEVVFTLEVDPTIPPIDISKFKLKKVKEPPVGEKEINEAIRQIQFFHATWQEITDRPVKENDFIILDIDSIEKEPHERIFTNTRFEVTKKSMAKWLYDLVLGKEVNQKFEGFSIPDEDATEEEVASYPPKKVLVTLKKIETAILPELNDDFAKKTGVETVEEMKKSLNNILSKKSEEKVERETREQVNVFLINNAKFDLPASLIEDEKNHRLNNSLQNPQFKAKWNSMTSEERKDIEDKLISQSKISIYLFYLSKKIVKDNNIQIDPEEIENQALALTNKSSKKELDRNDYAFAFSTLILSKAQDYILEQSQKKS